MQITIENLIDVLKTKPQDAKVEYIVVQTNGLLVAANVESNAAALSKVLKMF